MTFSKTAAYSIRILTMLAKQEGKIVSVRVLHEELKLPFKYITKLMTALAKHGFVKAIRGREGGFRLAKEPRDISIYSIVEAVDGIKEKEVCTLLFEECSDTEPCAIHPFIYDIKKMFRARLKETNLSMLAAV